MLLYLHSRSAISPHLWLGALSLNCNLEVIFKSLTHGYGPVPKAVVRLRANTDLRLFEPLAAYVNFRRV